MSEPRGTDGDAVVAGHSAGEADQTTTGQSEQNTGSDVGGPAATGESTTEQAITGTGTIGSEDESSDQATDGL